MPVLCLKAGGSLALLQETNYLFGVVFFYCFLPWGKSMVLPAATSSEPS